MRLKTTLAGFALLTGMTISGQAATIIFSDNFDSGTPGYALTGAIDGDFTVTSNNVDLVGGAFAGNLCVGLETTNCVDTDGSPSGNMTNFSGTITSIPIGVIAGNTYTLAFDINGSQRNFGATSTTDVTLTGTGNTNLVNTAITEPYTFIASAANSYSFTAGSTGNVTLAFASVDPAGQTAGNLIDNVVITNTTVAAGTPEPISMLLFGSGLLAVSMIGRKKLVRK